MRKKALKALGWLLKLAILVCTFLLIYRAVAHNENLNEDFFSITSKALIVGNWPSLLAIFLLIFVNLLFEAAKWQVMASKIGALTFWEAFQGVLVGLAMSFVSATNAGGFMGRVWHLKSSSRYEVLGAAVLNMFAQNYVTYTFGCFALLYFLVWKGVVTGMLVWALLILLCITIPLSGYLVARSVKFVQLLERFKWLYQYVQILNTYTWQEMGRVTFFSLCRYLAYFLQFLFIVNIYGIALPLPQMLAGIALVYWAKIIIPNFSVLTDLGIRQFSALQFLGEDGFGASNMAVLSATLTVWFINVLFPVVLGVIFYAANAFLP